MPADWTPRYLVHNKEMLSSIIEDDTQLLRKFGAHPIGFQPGVSFQIGDGPSAPSIQLNDAGWNWLRPILEAASEEKS